MTPFETALFAMLDEYDGAVDYDDMISALQLAIPMLEDRKAEAAEDDTND